MNPMYSWLDKDSSPKLLREALRQTDPSNLMTLAAELGYMLPDSAHMGSLWLTKVARDAGLGMPADPFRYRSWIRWCRALIPDVQVPSLGDVVLAKEDVPMLGIYIGEDIAAYHLLTARPSGDVDVVRLPKDQFWCARRPAEDDCDPEAIAPVQLKASGARKD